MYYSTLSVKEILSFFVSFRNIFSKLFIPVHTSICILERRTDYAKNITINLEEKGGENMSIIIDSRVSYEEFSLLFMDALENLLGSEKKLEIKKVKKNNNTEKDGIMLKDPPCGFSPTFYMEDLYDLCMSGVPVNKIMDDIYPYYAGNYAFNPLDEIGFDDFTSVKDKIICKLIHTGRNYSLLKETPGIPYLDLSVIFAVYAARDEHGFSSIRINNEQMELWGTTAEELYALALENSKTLLGSKLVSMDDLLKEMLNSGLYSNELCENNFYTETKKIIDDSSAGILNRSEIFVLTNNIKVHGASALLYTDLKPFAEKKESDLYIIPSSIHELIVVPASTSIPFRDLNKIIKDINKTELMPQEILSDHVYMYIKDEDKVISKY